MEGDDGAVIRHNTVSTRQNLLLWPSHFWEGYHNQAKEDETLLRMSAARRPPGPAPGRQPLTKDTGGSDLEVTPRGRPRLGGGSNSNSRCHQGPPGVPHTDPWLPWEIHSLLIHLH